MSLAAPADEVGELADLIVTWSGLVLAAFGLLMSVLTILFVAAGFVGIRELRSIRETGQQARRELDAQKQVSAELIDGTNRAVEAAGALSKEASSLLERARRAVEIAESQSDQIRILNTRLQTQIDDLDQRLTTLVEVSYLFNQGELAYRLGEYDKAIEFFHGALALDPRNARIRYRLGRSLTNLGRSTDAARELSTARRDGLREDQAERALAYLFRYEDPERAENHARRAAEAGPDNTSNWNGLGLLLRDRGKIDEAYAAHSRAVELSGSVITTPFFLALLAARLGRRDEALARSTEAIHLLETEQRARIANIWATVIRWGDAVLRDDVAGAEHYADELAQTCPSRRRAQEIAGHMTFLLRALGRSDQENRYLGGLYLRWPVGQPRGTTD